MSQVQQDDDSATSAEPPPSPAVWLDIYGDYLFSYALARVRDRHTAEDLVQETLLAGIEAYGKYETRSSVKTWLTSILRHKMIDHFRRTGGSSGSHPRASQSLPFPDEAALERVVDAQFNRRGVWKVLPRQWKAEDADPSRAIESEEFRRVLMECLEHLPPQSAEAMDLAERRDLSLKQISMNLGVTTSNVGVILFRARGALRRCLEMRWFCDT